MNSINTLDTAYHSDLLLVSNITAGLSFLGGCWIFFTFFKMGSLMTYSGKMILCMNISYFIYTITNMLSNFNEEADPNLCTIEGFFRTFAVLSAFFWAWKISQTAYYSIIDPHYRLGEQTSSLRVFGGFVLPLLMSAIPLFGFSLCSYRYIGPHCGIEAVNDTAAFIIYLFIDIIPPIVSLIWTAYFAFRIIRFSRTWGSMGISPMRLLIYPFVLTAIWFPTLLASLFSYYGHDFLALEIIRIGLTNLLGFMHAIIYAVQTRRLSQLEDEKSRQQPTLETQNVDTTSVDTSFELTRSRLSSMENFIL